jgi:hypothetical protein
MVSSRGAKPATLAPPDSPAPQIQEERQSATRPFWHSVAFKAVEAELTRDPGDRVVLPDDADDEGAQADIDAVFRRKLAAIRRLPKGDRPFARRAAMDERAAALLALRQKREIERRYRRFLRLLLAPAPQK